MSRAVVVATLVAGLGGDAAAELPGCHDRKLPRADFTMAAGSLRACYAGRKPACFTLDLDKTGGPAWVPVVPPRAAATDTLVPDVTIGTTAKVCAVDGTDCHTFVTPRATVSKYFGPQIYASANRSVFAVTLDDKVWLYDPGGALRATIKTWPHPGNVVWSVEHVAVAGYRVYVMMRSGMDAEVRAYDVRNGSPSTDVGVVDPVEPIDLGGGRVAFTMRRGASLDVYDEVAKRVRSVPLFSDGKSHATVFARNGKTIVVARGDDDTIAVVDTTAWTASKISPPPACP